MDNHIFEEGRGYRQKKPKMEPASCPICGITLRAIEIDQHFAFEMDRLDKLSNQNKPSRTKSGSSTTNEPSSSHSSNNIGGECSKSETFIPDKATNLDECWGTYQKIKTNRQARLKLKSRKRKSDENLCPVCNKKPTEEISIHVEKCLRKSENGNTNNGNDSEDDDESIDVEGESLEEYEFDGETRIRVGTFHPTGVGTKIMNADTDDELNVDGDDQIYGPPQYSERDVIIPAAEDEKNNSHLRNLVISNQPQHIRDADEAAGEGTSSRTIPESRINSVDVSQNDPEYAAEILRERIREYENYMHNRPKCLICMDDFKKPVVSVCCWHVYCEKCWLRTLGAKKLCPQCSMITSPTDLRRIYL